MSGSIWRSWLQITTAILVNWLREVGRLTQHCSVQPCSVLGHGELSRLQVQTRDKHSFTWENAINLQFHGEFLASMCKSWHCPQLNYHSECSVTFKIDTVLIWSHIMRDEYVVMLCQPLTRMVWVLSHQPTAKKKFLTICVLFWKGKRIAKLLRAKLLTAPQSHSDSDSRRVIAFLSFPVTSTCFIDATALLLPVDESAKTQQVRPITPVALHTKIIADMDSQWQMTCN